METKDKVITDLIPAEYNPRHLSHDAFNHLKASIERFGAVDPAIVNIHPDRKNIIIGGHQRIKVAKSLGWETFPCVEVNLDRDKERELNIRLNKNTGAWDWDELANYFDVDELTEWGFDDEELFGEFEDDDLDAEDDDYEIPDEVNTDFVLGDMIEIGEHRLMCGDSANSNHVEKLMNKKQADIVFTDPPYGVSYVGKTKDAMTIENDALSEDELSEKIMEWFNCVDIVLKPGGYILATVPARPLHIHFISDWKDRGWLRQIMVWNKDRMVLGHSEYHYKHEPILFGWKEGGKRLKNDDRTKTTVWDFDRPKASREHPTMKPVEMWSYGIKNHSKKYDVLFEPFTGGGTAMIACHQLDRKCYGMEIDPKYCQVIVDRMLKLDPSLTVQVNGKAYKKE